MVAHHRPSALEFQSWFWYVLAVWPFNFLRAMDAKDMDFLAAGIEAVDPARAGPMAPSLRDGEKISLLPTARATSSV